MEEKLTDRIPDTRVSESPHVERDTIILVATLLSNIGEIPILCIGDAGLSAFLHDVAPTTARSSVVS